MEGTLVDSCAAEGNGKVNGGRGRGAEVRERTMKRTEVIREVGGGRGMENGKKETTSKILPSVVRVESAKPIIVTRNVLILAQIEDETYT
jgi:hypothetical protein